MNSPDEPVDFEDPLDFEDPEKIQPVKKSKVGFILSIIGAILVLLNAIALFFLPSSLSNLSEAQLEAFEPLAEQANMPVEQIMAHMYSIMGGFGIVCAILIIVGGLLAYYKGMKVAGGILIIIFSILSIFSLGGFLIGMILGIIGGILVLMNK